MGILDKMVDTIAKKVMFDTAVNAAVKTVGAVVYNNSKREQSESIIKVPNSSDHYFGMGYQDTQDELVAYGFTNIVLLPKRDLIKGWLTKDGAVEEVSIKGKTEFKENSKFPANVRIVITYHTFRNSKLDTRQHTITNNIEDIHMACCSNCGVQIAANTKLCSKCDLPITSDSSDYSTHQKEISRKINKCYNCGEVLRSSESFCHACGYKPHLDQPIVCMGEFTQRLDQMDGLHMHYCTNCGTKMLANAKFCAKCGSQNTRNYSSSPERQQEYVGKILKCPNCGELLKSFEGICHSCGHEVNSVKMSTSFNAFVVGITECDTSIARSPVPPKKGFRTWSKRGKFWWVILNVFTLCIPLALYLIMPLLGIWGVAAFLPDEKRKAALIKNYAFPNDRESVLEILLYIKSQMAFIASEKIDRNSVYWARIWGNKAEQIFQKSELIINGDAISVSVHSDIVLNWEKIKKAFSIRVGIALVFIVALIVFRAVGGGPLNLLSNPFKSVSNPFEETFEWPDTELSRLIPQPESDKGKIQNINAGSLWIEVHDFSISQFESYINNCKEKGFSVEGKRQGNSYKARNASGYRLDLDFTQYDLQMTIHLNEPKVIGEFEWPSTEICNLLPVPESNKGEISRSDEEQLWITVYNLSEEQCNVYIEACKENGFSIDSKTDSISYEAYNESGFHLKLIYFNVSEHGFNIECNAPMEMEAIRWPNTTLVKEIPIPKTDFGKIDSEYGFSFTVNIANTTPKEYADYVDACVEKGFTKGIYSRDKTHFYGDNSAGSTISVDYIGFSIMKIEIRNFDY